MIMERIKGQDEQALSVLYRRHLPLLRTVISRVLNNDWDVDDLMTTHSDSEMLGAVIRAGILQLW